MNYKIEQYDAANLSVKFNDEGSLDMNLKCSRIKSAAVCYEYLELSVKIDIDTARKISILAGCMSFNATGSVQVDVMNIDINWYITIDRPTDTVIFSLEFPVVSEEIARKDSEIFESPLFRYLLNSEHRGILYITDGANNIIDTMYRIFNNYDRIKNHTSYAVQQNIIEGERLMLI